MGYAVTNTLQTSDFSSDAFRPGVIKGVVGKVGDVFQGTVNDTLNLTPCRHESAGQMAMVQDRESDIRNLLSGVDADENTESENKIVTQYAFQDPRIAERTALKEELIPYFGYPQNTHIKQNNFSSCFLLAPSFPLTTFPVFWELWNESIEVDDQFFIAQAPFDSVNQKEYRIPKKAFYAPHKHGTFPWFKTLSKSNTSVNFIEYLYYAMTYGQKLRKPNVRSVFCEILTQDRVNDDHIKTGEEFCEAIREGFGTHAYILQTENHALFVRRRAIMNDGTYMYEVFDPMRTPKWYDEAGIKENFVKFLEFRFIV